MSVYFLLLFAPRLGLLCPMGISGDYEETNGRPALVPPNTQPAKFLLRYKYIFKLGQILFWRYNVQSGQVQVENMRRLMVSLFLCHHSLLNFCSTPELGISMEHTTARKIHIGQLGSFLFLLQLHPFLSLVTSDGSSFLEQYQ